MLEGGRETVGTLRREKVRAVESNTSIREPSDSDKCDERSTGAMTLENDEIV